MAGATVNSIPATGVNAGVSRGANMTGASYVNSFRISAVADRLAKHVCNQPKIDPQEFVHLCLSLARGIDFAIANREVPNRAQDLPLLVKQVCRIPCDTLLLAHVMVLMISVKNACHSGWFTEKDAKELCDLANEISSSFCTTLDFNTEPSSSSTIISTIMSRFYPRLKMGQIVSFLEAKPGFGAYVNDFQITKNMNLSEGEKVRLFVAQIDNLETSLCLVTPPQVNFLLNGTPVGRRTNVSMDPGPQLPSPVPHMLKFGTNLLQAVGQFNGNYIIAVAFMSEISTPVQATLPDYEQAPVSSVDPDSEIIEGPSRISLNCPISFKRIKTPVKGHSCKHLQCFDFDNYIDINSRRPSWRCPHCNQHVCFTDIHIDQDMFKVLKEVSEDVTDVMISSDGSWKAIMESDDYSEKPRDKTPEIAQDSPRRGSDGPSNAPGDVLDLTDIDDDMNPAETEDSKIFPTNIQMQSNVQKTTAVNNPSEINQTGAPDMTDDFWSRIYLSSCGIGTSSSWSSMQTGSASEPARTDLVQLPVFTDAISPAFNTEGNAFIPTSILESGLSSSNLLQLQLQQFQFGNSALSNEYGRFPTASRPANRTPVAVQALPAQMNTPVPQQRQQSTMNPLFHAGPSAATQDLPIASLDGSNLRSELERHSFSDLDLVQARTTSSVLPQKRSLPHVQPSQHSVGRQTPSMRTPYSMSQSQGPTQSATWDRWEALKQGSSQVGVNRALAGGQHTRVVTTQQTTQVVRPVYSPRTVSPLPGSADRFRTPLAPDQRGSTGGTTPVTRTDISMDPQLDPNWRPTGRMRGSLSGRAYSEALQQFILKPTQQAQAQAARPSIPPNLSPQLQVLLANRGAHSTQPVNFPSTAPANASDISGILPERSSGMQ
ncbi:E4 SUMO-protein ligase PIAL2-like isoform X1 [Solanum stenotomum]|uniref:E4 SUMO-protein ligase PIAL2-like isoform X1 n=1 Tax=Solanum stenotomum TaxID=172797 RepID=UPI0020D02024|nr:E4 SUMO-protein ligase PIAL2-like isoform X1 [Solanum stenotomum]